MDVPEAIRTLREARRWSQDRLAREIGRSVSNIQKWEQGKVAPHPEICGRLARLAPAGSAAAIELQRRAEEAGYRPATPEEARAFAEILSLPVAGVIGSNEPASRTIAVIDRRFSEIEQKLEARLQAIEQMVGARVNAASQLPAGNVRPPIDVDTGAVSDEHSWRAYIETAITEMRSEFATLRAEIAGLKTSLSVSEGSTPARVKRDPIGRTLRLRPKRFGGGGVL